MRKLVVLGILASASLLCFSVGTVNAFQRFVPQFRPAPVYRPMPQYRPVPQFRPQYRPMPQVRINPGIRPGMRPGFVQPRVPLQHFGNLGRHGFPMVHGIHGWHETHNLAHFRFLPGPRLSGEEYGNGVDLDSFVDSIDDSAPLLPLEACSDDCSMYAAIVVSNDGSWGASWNAISSDNALQAATGRCLQNAREPCNGTLWVLGTAWIAAIHCENLATHWSSAAAGNDPQDAVTNAYRNAFQRFGYTVDQCSVLTFVTPDGSQQQFVQQE